MKLIFSLVMLAVPIAVYWFIIRPRLQARLTDTYAYIDGFWARLWARLVAFRTFVLASLAVYVTELPALLEQLQLVSLDWLPDAWQSTVRILLLVAVMIVRARATTPAGAPERP